MDSSVQSSNIATPNPSEKLRLASISQLLGFGESCIGFRSAAKQLESNAFELLLPWQV